MAALGGLKTIPGGSIVLLTAHPDRISDARRAALKELLGKGKKAIYVTADKTCGELISEIKGSGVDLEDVYIIDCISKFSSGRAEQQKACEFLDTPKDLAEIGAGIADAAQRFKNEGAVVVIDSLSSLRAYNNDEEIGKFADFVVSVLRHNEIGAVIMASAHVPSSTLGAIGKLCDQVVEI